MVAFNFAEREQVSAPPGAGSRIPVRGYAVVTGLACLSALGLAQVGGPPSQAGGGPWSVVVAQALWNAAQVGLLLLLLCLWRLERRGWVIALGLATLASLPFAIYVVSPGAWALTALLVLTCALALIRDTPDLSVAIVDAPPGAKPILGKVELLGLVCYLLSSMYNYNASKLCFPYWSSIYASVAGAVGFTADLGTIARAMYTLGIDGAGMPPYVTPGRAGNNLGAVIFLVIWTILPVLYILYFAASAKLARGLRGAWIQQALCLVGILHFLFLTDLVDYQFGRGIVNPTAEWCHWIERFVWRLAILLPIYQKVASGHLLRGNGRIGVILHYAVAAWAAFFFLYQVVIYDLPRFYQFAVGDEMTYQEIFGVSYRQELGYHGALVLMILLYGFMLLRMRCKQVEAAPVRSEGGGV